MEKQTSIVLIDDDQDACELLKFQLENNGKMRLTYKTTSDDAASFIAGESPDIVILDINMTGINGVEVGAALTANKKTAAIPILYLSGMITPDEVQDLVKGAQPPPVISKGFPVEELISAINFITSP